MGDQDSEGFAVSPLEDEVEPLGDEADPEHCDAHAAGGVVGRGEVEQKEALGIAQKGDPEPHVLQPRQLVLQRLGHRDARAQRGLHGDPGAGRAGMCSKAEAEESRRQGSGSPLRSKAHLSEPQAPPPASGRHRPRPLPRPSAVPDSREPGL